LYLPRQGLTGHVPNIAMVVLPIDELIYGSFDILEVQPFTAVAMHPHEKHVVVAMHPAALGMPGNNVGGGKFTFVKPRNIKRV